MFRLAIYASCFSTCAFFSLTNAVLGQQWSDLQLTVKLDSQASLLSVSQSQVEVSGGLSMNNESMIVNPRNNAIQNVVLMLDERRTKFDQKLIHPTVSDVPDRPAILDVIQFRFEPHVLCVRAGQNLRVRNRNGRNHNVKFNFFANEDLNRQVLNANIFEMPLKLSERNPIRIDCNMDPRMKAFLIVADHPYVGMSDFEGQIRIEKLPAGIPITFRIWHESQDQVIEGVNLNGRSQTWPMGSVT